MVASMAFLILAVLSLPSVSGALLHSLEIYPPISSEQLPRAQAIVILSGDDYVSAPEYGGDTVGGGTLERLRYAVHLQRRSSLPILVSGGVLRGTRPIAETMKEVAEGELGGRVKWVESTSRDTAENAAYSASMLMKDGISRIVLVSHAWHLPRARQLFEWRGLQVVPAPTGFTTRPVSYLKHPEAALPSTASLDESATALHEWLGIVVQRSMRRIP
jgi:uncharacterized SAM-binding protein YcdF (DUF218 family)